MNDDLLVSYLLNEAGEGDRIKVEQWIGQNPSNQKYFDHFRTIWEASSRVIIPESVNEDLAWQRFQQRVKKTAPVRSLSVYLSRLRIAAVIIAGISALALAYMAWEKSSSRPVTYAALQSSITETLPDGSTAILNKNSEITYTAGSGENERKVTLKGEAFFKVQPDKNKPFKVGINDLIITVLGTSFNIKSINGKTEVIVETGSVKVERNNKSVILKSGEKTIVEDKDSVITKQSSTDKLYNYYRSHEFVCDSTPIWKLVEVLNEAYGSNIIIENKELRNQPITTTFSNEPLDKILSVISETFSVSVEHRGKEIILK